MVPTRLSSPPPTGQNPAPGQFQNQVQGPVQVPFIKNSPNIINTLAGYLSGEEGVIFENSLDKYVLFNNRSHSASGIGSGSAGVSGSGSGSGTVGGSVGCCFE